MFSGCSSQSAYNFIAIVSPRRNAKQLQRRSGSSYVVRVSLMLPLLSQAVVLTGSKGPKLKDVPVISDIFDGMKFGLQPFSLLAADHLIRSHCSGYVGS